MPPADIVAEQYRHELFGDLSVDIVEDQLRITQNCIERCAQFMTHICQELGLVSAGKFELALFDLEVFIKLEVVRQGLLEAEIVFPKGFIGPCAFYDASQEGAYVRHDFQQGIVRLDCYFRKEFQYRHHLPPDQHRKAERRFDSYALRGLRSR